MDFLKEYSELCREVYPAEVTRNLFFGVSVVYLPLFWYITKNSWKTLVYTLLVFLLHSSFMETPTRTFDIRREGERVVLCIRGKSPKFHFMVRILTYLIPGLAMKILGGGWDGDPGKMHAKLFSSTLVNTMCRERRIKLCSPSLRIPRRKIIVTNHVQRPILDSLSLFPLCRGEDPIIILQHNFNQIITFLGEWIWGSYTIDKDDKTPRGKRVLEERLQGLVDIMRRGENLTVVVYAQGKVPKTTEDVRRPGVFYPGAFYLSLMTGYPILPLVNDLSEGVLTNSCLEPVDLEAMVGGRVIRSDTVGEFRKINAELLTEVGETFREMFANEYKEIRAREKKIGETKRTTLHACRPSETGPPSKGG